jgi:hypothetical protein
MVEEHCVKIVQKKHPRCIHSDANHVFSGTAFAAGALDK